MKPIWTLLWCLLFAACSDDPTGHRIAGGSAVEGETITARLVDSQGRALGEMSVGATSPEVPDWSLDVATDGSGALRIAVPRGAREIVLTLDDPDFPGQKLVFRITLRPTLDTTIVVEKWGGLGGRVACATGWTPISVSIEGLGIHVAVESGAFSVAHLPAGTWPLTLRADSLGTSGVFELGTVAMPAGGTSVYREFQVRSDTYFALSFDEIARWDSAAVCMFGNTPGSMSDSVLAGCASAASGGAAWSGSSLRLHLAGSAARLAGARLATVPAGGDGNLMVSSTDTLAFMARGTGHLDVVLGIKGPNGIRTVRAASFQLAATWNRHAWPVSVWLGSDSISSVAWIGIVTEEEAWMVLDRLELSGR